MSDYALDLPENFHAVLRVLAITVIIDDKVRKTEREEFSEQACGLAELCESVDFTKVDAKAWYTRHEASLREDLSGRSRNTVILKGLTAVKDAVLQEALYDGILAVSVSDTEYHRKESDLVRSAATIWGFVRPPFKVVDTE